jgi:GT2 family glycosyltransferase
MKDIVPPKVLVVLLNYRTAHMTLRAAKAALADMPFNAEMVIIDNASGDGSAEVLASGVKNLGQGARVRLILSEVNGGFGAGNNIGLTSKMSDGTAPEFFYVLNSDAFPDKGCIPTLLAHMEAQSGAGFAASHVRGEDDVPHTTAFRFPSIAGEFEGAARIGPVSRLLKGSIVAPPLPEATTQVDWAAGASIMIRAETLDDIGGFDETFFLYFEETDLIRRAKRAGWSCWYVPAARVVHIGSVSTGMKEWKRMPGYWFESRRHYFVKNHGHLYAGLAWLARVSGAALHQLRCKLSGQPSQDAAHFLSDLTRFGLNLRPREQPTLTPRTPSEDHP